MKRKKKVSISSWGQYSKKTGVHLQEVWDTWGCPITIVHVLCKLWKSMPEKLWETFMNTRGQQIKKVDCCISIKRFQWRVYFGKKKRFTSLQFNIKMFPHQSHSLLKYTNSYMSAFLSLPLPPFCQVWCDGWQYSPHLPNNHSWWRHLYMQCWEYLGNHWHGSYANSHK